MIAKHVGAASTPPRSGALEGAPTRLWQRGFYEHVIRNDADFTEKARYIEAHPIKEPGSIYSEWH